MGIIYLAALIVGAGTIALQLVMSGHGDADAGGDVGGHDLSLDADAPVDLDAGGHDLALDADADAPVDVHADHGGHADVGGGFLPIFLSLRFWTFGFMAFGIVGTLLHYLGLASAVLIPFIALAMGLASGFLASWSFRALSRAATTSGAQVGDVVGHVGKVLVSCNKNSRGKVRIELRGQSLDYLATTDDEQLDEGELVLVEEMRDGNVHVSRAPAEFLATKRD